MLVWCKLLPFLRSRYSLAVLSRVQSSVVTLQLLSFSEFPVPDHLARFRRRVLLTLHSAHCRLPFSWLSATLLTDVKLEPPYIPEVRAARLAVIASASRSSNCSLPRSTTHRKATKRGNLDVNRTARLRGFC